MNIAPYIFCFFIVILPPKAYSAEQSSPAHMNLADCIDLALAHSPDLGMAQATFAQNKALLDSAKKNLLPSFSAHYSYKYQPNSIYSPTDEYGYGLTAEQPIYQGKAIVTSIKQAEISLNSAQKGTDRIINELIFQVYTNYFKVLRAVKVATEAQNSVNRLKSHRSDAKAFFDAGIIPRNDFLQSDVELAQGEQDFVDAQIEAFIARAELNILLGRDTDMALHLEDNYAKEQRENNWDDILHSALTNRPEIMQAKLGAEMAKKEVTIKKAPFLPKISLSASYDKRGDRADGARSDELGWPAEEKTVSAVATWKLWTWQKNKNEITAAKKDVRRAKKAIAQTIDRVSLETRIAFQRLQQTEKRIKVSERAITHAEENYRITQARYQSQIATSTQVLDAQALLTQAKTNYYDSFYGHKVALAAVERASGRLGQKYSHTTNESAEQGQP